MNFGIYFLFVNFGIYFLFVELWNFLFVEFWNFLFVEFFILFSVVLLLIIFVNFLFCLVIPVSASFYVLIVIVFFCFCKTSHVLLTDFDIFGFLGSKSWFIILAHFALGARFTCESITVNVEMLEIQHWQFYFNECFYYFCCLKLIATVYRCMCKHPYNCKAICSKLHLIKCMIQCFLCGNNIQCNVTQYWAFNISAEKLLTK
mgnify:CR=1 FL=1